MRIGFNCRVEGNQEATMLELGVYSPFDNGLTDLDFDSCLETPKQIHGYQNDMLVCVDESTFDTIAMAMFD